MDLHACLKNEFTEDEKCHKLMNWFIFNSLSLNHNLFFVQYNVQSILNKVDVLHTELFEFDILAFTETWLNPTILIAVQMI